MTDSDAKPPIQGFGVNQTLGIIGGGQLGRMIAVEAARYGCKVIILDPQPECPAGQVSNRQIAAAYDNKTALTELADLCDVVTYEFENVPFEAAELLEELTELFPSSRALAVSQDRLVEKSTLEQANIAVAPYFQVDSGEELRGALSKVGEGVLKTRRFGYDGNGQKVVGADDAKHAEAIVEELGGGDLILEKKIAFISEFSVIVARSRHGEVVCYEPATNIHRDGILRLSSVPADLSDSTISKAVQVAERWVGELDYVGVMGIEFFETSDGLLVNEFAPRVHNSGHWTREACHTGQFEQHFRAVMGLHLAATTRHSNCEMVNLIGHDVDDLNKWLSDPDGFVTIYGKADVKPGRKMGHVTRLLR